MRVYTKQECATGVNNWRVRGSSYLPRCLAAQEDIGSGQARSASPTLPTGAFVATVATAETSTACHLHLDSGGHNLILLVRRQRQLGQQERLVELQLVRQLVRQLGQRLPQLVWQARQHLQQHMAQRTGSIWLGALGSPTAPGLAGITMRWTVVCTVFTTIGLWCGLSVGIWSGYCKPHRVLQKEGQGGRTRIW